MSGIMLVIIIFAFAMQDIINHYPSTAFPFLKDGKLKRWLLNDWTSKYVNGDPNQGRKKFYIMGIGIIIPVAVLDGWHFFRFILIMAILVNNALMLLPINFFLTFIVQSVIYLIAWYIFYETNIFSGREAKF